MANEQTAAKQAEYKAWINSHTPLQIYQANKARVQLRRKLLKTKGSRGAHTEQLKDDRLPKGPVQAYIIFTAERWASGDMKGLLARESGKVIAEEWKALTAGEKKVCNAHYISESHSHLHRNTKMPQLQKLSGIVAKRLQRSPNGFYKWPKELDVACQTAVSIQDLDSSWNRRRKRLYAHLYGIMACFWRVERYRCLFKNLGVYVRLPRTVVQRTMIFREQHSDAMQRKLTWSVY